MTDSRAPCSHTDQLRVWAVDISGWADSLLPVHDAGPPSSASAAGQSGDPTRRGQGTPVDAVIEELFGPYAQSQAASEDMTRASVKIRRYMREVDRVRSLAGQLLPRVMYMHQYPDWCSWSNMRFRATKEKRPFLVEPALQDGTDYNVTHDGDWIALAFHARNRQDERRETEMPGAPSPSTNQPDSDALAKGANRSSHMRVGIDVMAIALPHYDPTVTGFVSMMELAMTPAEKAWVISAAHNKGDPRQPKARFPSTGSSKPSRGQAVLLEALQPDEHETLMRLYDLWTYKEAFTKNVGRGLGFDFSTIEVALWRCAAVPLLPSDNNDALTRGEGSALLASARDEGTDSRETDAVRTMTSRAARQHASRTSARSSDGKPARSILTLAGEPEGRYSFVEIHLPASRVQEAASDQDAPRSSRARSQLVVCEGPHEGTVSSDHATNQDSPPVAQIAPALDADNAIETGLLRLWTMAELVQEARTLRSR